MKKIAKILSLLMISITALPVFAEATDFKTLIDDVFISGIIKPLVPLLIGLAVVIFLYGVILLMFSEGGDKKEEGKQYMLWGIIGIFVMVSVWGLVGVLQGTFNLDNIPQKVEIKLKS